MFCFDSVNCLPDFESVVTCSIYVPVESSFGEFWKNSLVKLKSKPVVFLVAVIDVCDTVVRRRCTPILITACENFKSQKVQTEVKAYCLLIKLHTIVHFQQLPTVCKK